MKKLPKSFCWRPFTQVIIKKNLHKPCCYFQENLNYSGEFNKDVRDAILENRWHNGCKICKELDENKNTKKRSNRFLYDGPRDSNLVLENKFSAKIVEISVDKICNLACLTCGSHSSSKWKAENKRMGIEEDFQSFSNDISFYKNHNLWETAEICIIYGGEPLYSKNTLNFLKFLIENNFSKKLQLEFNTNGTIINDKIIELLQYFKSCKIKFSIDGSYNRFNIIRWPANYEIVKENFQTISKIKNVTTHVIYTYSILNAVNFIEDYKILSRELTNDIALNIVVNPKIYAARNLPENVKNELINMYRNKNHINENIAYKIIGELEMPQYSNEIDKLIKKLKTYDFYRKTDSSILFPSELWALADK